MKLSIKKFQQINRKITLNLDKLTIVTGVNGVGKTNISKILYCLLKSNCYNRNEPALESITKHIDELVNKIRVRHKIDLVLPVANTYEYIGNYLDLKEEFKLEHHALYEECYKEDFKLLDKLIKIVKDNGLELHVSLLRTLLKGMYGTDSFNGEITLTNDDNVYCLDFNEDFYSDDFLEYEECGVFYDVFYLDNSGTLLDYMDYNGIFNCIYMDDVRDAILMDKNSFFDNSIFLELEHELVDIIGGVFDYTEQGDFIFKSRVDDHVYSLSNCGGGARGLGVLYLLLHYHNIGPDSFLIFDEVECNLHPEKQLLLGEWLCKFVKNTGVNIYVNTKSPLFMEAIEVYSMKHKLEDNVSYILLDYSKDNNIKAINTDRLGVYKLYDNLGDPYDIIDEQRIENTFNL